jgi:D-lactate dehydrogenase (cytochrome)
VTVSEFHWLGSVIEARLPSYQRPHTRKNATGYFVAPNMDVLDLFIGSEGTLAVVIEIEVRLLTKPQGLLSGVVFFESESDVLSFVAECEVGRLKIGKQRMCSASTRGA